MPGSVIEAMALEVPIVATELPQVREVTGSDGALLVPVSDDRRLASAIISCVTDRGDADRRVVNARERFLRHFTIRHTAREMIDFYHRALGGPTS